MSIKSFEIPQADNLKDVIGTLSAVNSGATSYQEIAESIGKVERQGRYYRLAAQLLGFIKPSGTNNSEVTELGLKYINANSGLKKDILLNSVLNTPIIQTLIPYFESHPLGVTRAQVIKFIESVSEITGDSMIPRRISTIISWLKYLDVVLEEGLSYKLNVGNIKFPSLNFNNVSEPIVPSGGKLKEYIVVAERTERAKEMIVTMRDQVSMERANKIHTRLVNRASEKIRNVGSIPRMNSIIDLATKFQNQSFIFEIKSLTTQNERSQIRKGLSQLYEYQYLQNLSGSNLVLIIERQLSDKTKWMEDYLQLDRNILLIWDGDNKFYADDQIKEKVPFLF
jgi:hypothetical protein